MRIHWGQNKKKVKSKKRLEARLKTNRINKKAEQEWIEDRNTS